MRHVRRLVLPRLLPSLLLLLAAACSDAQPVLPSNEPAVVAVQISPEELSLRIEESLLLEAQALGQDGHPLTRPTTMTWASSDPSVVEVNALGRLRAIQVGEATILASAEGVEGRARVAVLPPPVEELKFRLPKEAVIEDDVLLMSTGDSVRVSAVAVDVEGAEIPGARPRLRSSNSTVLSVDSLGWLRAGAGGSARLTANLEGQSTTLNVEVRWAEATELALRTPSPLVLGVGESAVVEVDALDARGNRVPASGIIWESSSEAVASVSTTGQVQALSVGDASITARMGELQAQVQVVVSPTGDLRIGSVEPTTLSPGTTVSIRGEGFGDDASALSLTLGDVELVVLTAADAEVSARVPATAPGACLPTRSERLAITRQVHGTARTIGTDVLYRSAPELSLEPGESRELNAAETSCWEFAEARGEYMLSVFNASETAAAKVAVEVKGSLGGKDAGVLSGPGANTAADPVGARSIARPLSAAAATAGADAHARLLEMNRRIGSALGKVPDRRATGPAFTRSAAPAEGDTEALRFPRFQGQDVCTSFDPVSARVVYAGKYAVILEDPANPRSGEMDAELRAMGQEFDDEMMDLLRHYFGDPLAMDERLDGNGKLLMLFTPKVNQYMPGALAFVTALDFYATTACAASNQGEIFYANVPTTESVAEWVLDMRGTLVHEVKHLISYAERLSVDSPLESAWLEEGSAKLAEEIWVRDLYGRHARQNLGFDPIVACDYNPNGAGCLGKPSVMTSHFVFWSRYLANNEAQTPLGNPQDAGNSVYGSAWALIRWGIDHTSGLENSLTRALVRGPETGIANLRARTGMSTREMIGGYTLASAVDDLPGFSPDDETLTMPSWNTRDVYQGLFQRHGTRLLPSASPLNVRGATFGDFSLQSTALPGGTAMVVRLSGEADATQLVELKGNGGMAPSASLGVRIVRIR